jgi:subtilisin family serine protease
MSSIFTIEPPRDNVVCPNCRAVVVAGLFCSNCNAPLTFEVSRAAQSVGFVTSLTHAEELLPPRVSAVRISESVPLETLAAAEIEINPDMDPRLQRLVMRAQQGVRKLATSSTGVDEVAVVAKVTDVDAWEALSEVRVGALIKSYDKDDDTSLVTARIPVQRIERVRAQPFVKSLKPGQRVAPSLFRTTPEIGASPNLLPAAHLADGGRGVLIGIIDFGCDFMHENLRNPDGTSRVLALWDQAGPSGPQSPFGYGRVITKAEIDAALGQPNPYAALGYEPTPDTPFEKGTHGTHVTDIAAGNGRGSNLPGVAPNADIIFVEASLTDIPQSGLKVVEQSFGDSIHLLEAIRFIFDTAGNRPCVVNLSQATNGGPHDGTTLVEQGIDRLLSEAPNRAVVIAAANSFDDGIHATGNVPAGGSFDLVWNIPTGDDTNNELEIWYDGDDRLTLEVIAPNGVSLMTVNPGENKTLSRDNLIVLLGANRLRDPNNLDNMIGVFMEPGLPVGRWTIRLHGTVVNNGLFHAWIERDDRGQSSFLPPFDDSHTLGSVSCGKLSVAVGSYDAHKASRPLSFFSSAGPTRDGREKPEVSAPGHDVIAAQSRTRTLTTRKRGTSQAAPAVAGIIALMLAEAQARRLSLTTSQIRDILIATARRNPPPGTGWDSRFGHGRVSASGAVARVIAMAPVPPTPIAPTAPETAMATKGAVSGKRGASKKGSAAKAGSSSKRSSRTSSVKKSSKTASKKAR